MVLRQFMLVRDAHGRPHRGRSAVRKGRAKAAGRAGARATAAAKRRAVPRPPPPAPRGDPYRRARGQVSRQARLLQAELDATMTPAEQLAYAAEAVRRGNRFDPSLAQPLTVARARELAQARTVQEDRQKAARDIVKANEDQGDLSRALAEMTHDRIKAIHTDMAQYSKDAALRAKTSATDAADRHTEVLQNIGTAAATVGAAVSRLPLPPKPSTPKSVKKSAPAPPAPAPLPMTPLVPVVPTVAPDSGIPGTPGTPVTPKGKKKRGKFSLMSWSTPGGTPGPPGPTPGGTGTGSGYSEADKAELKRAMDDADAGRFDRATRRIAKIRKAKADPTLKAERYIHRVLMDATA